MRHYITVLRNTVMPPNRSYFSKALFFNGFSLILRREIVCGSAEARSAGSLFCAALNFLPNSKYFAGIKVQN